MSRLSGVEGLAAHLTHAGLGVAPHELNVGGGLSLGAVQRPHVAHKKGVFGAELLLAEGAALLLPLQGGQGRHHDVVQLEGVLYQPSVVDKPLSALLIRAEIARHLALLVR